MATLTNSLTTKGIFAGTKVMSPESSRKRKRPPNNQKLNIINVSLTLHGVEAICYNIVSLLLNEATLNEDKKCYIEQLSQIVDHCCNLTHKGIEDYIMKQPVMSGQKLDPSVHSTKTEWVVKNISKIICKTTEKVINSISKFCD
jgi:hypothetical protein